MRITNLTYNRPIHPIAASFKGWSPENQKNKQQIETMRSVLTSGNIKKIAVSGHLYPDGDSIGSCFAMAHLLHSFTNRPVDVFIFGGLSKRYNYLKDDNYINVINIDGPHSNMEKKYGTYDLAVSVDTATTNLMDQGYYTGIYSKAKHKFKIDHHSQENVAPESAKKTFYADTYLVDSSSPAASELIMQFVEPLGLKPEKLPLRFNDSVYTGILTDSRSFSVTDSALPFNDTALLIKNGLKPQEVYKKTFANIPKEAADILSLAQKKVKFAHNNRIAYLYTDDVITKAISNLKDKELVYDVNSRLKDMVNELRNIKGVDFAIMFTKRGEDKLYVSIRSNEINVRNLAQKHNGGGHERAAGFVVPLKGSANLAITEVLQEFKQLR